MAASVAVVVRYDVMLTAAVAGNKTLITYQLDRRRDVMIVCLLLLLMLMQVR